MGLNLLPALGAVVSLGISTAFASVSCNTKHDPGNNGADTYDLGVEALAEIANNSIEGFCATGGRVGVVVEHCGPVMLTLTQPGYSAL